MRQLLAAIVFVCGTSLLTYPAAAQATNSQQERMKLCNKQAGDQKLAGEARKTFMSDCLSGKTTTAKPLTAQQQKMKDCAGKWGQEKKAKKVSGRKAYNEFMSGCLKG